MIPDGMTYNHIQDDDWATIDHFTPEEFVHPDWLDRQLIFTADRLRDYVGARIFLHCDFEFRDTGWHPHGKALDVHIEGMHPYDQYEAACRFDEFNGVGFYLWWNDPGIHIDTRPAEKIDYDARWFSPEKGIYLPVTAENLRRYL